MSSGEGEPATLDASSSSGDKAATEGATAQAHKSVDEHVAAFKATNSSAFVLGATGLVGQLLVEQLVDKKIFERIVIMSRRELPDLPENIKNAVEVKVVDFENLSAHQEAFRDLKVGYCALGSTRKKAGSAEAFYKIDHDYVVDSAKIAIAAGCEQFHLVSSQGANKDSSLLYTRTKGEVERDVAELNFKKLFIYRPGMLLGDRQESRPLEKIAAAVFFKPMSYISPTTCTTPASTVAAAMINATVLPSANPATTLDISSIFVMAGEDGKCKCN